MVLIVLQLSLQKAYIELLKNVAEGDKLSGTFTLMHVFLADSLPEIVMAALRSRCGHYIFCPVVCSSSFVLLFSSPNLSGRRLDVYHISTHDTALV